MITVMTKATMCMKEVAPWKIMVFNVPRITVCFDTVGASESRTAADD
jgi:hypothetical protein